MKDLSGAQPAGELVRVSFTEITLITDVTPSLGEKVLYGQEECEVSSRDTRTIPGKCIVTVYCRYAREADRAG